MSWRAGFPWGDLGLRAGKCLFGGVFCSPRRSRSSWGSAQAREGRILCLPAGCRAVCEMLREMQRCRAESRERRSAPPGWTAPPSSGLPRELQPRLRPGQTLLPSKPGTHTRGQHSCYVFDVENIVDAAGCCPKEMLRWGCSYSERETPGDTSDVCKCLEPDSDVQ